MGVTQVGFPSCHFVYRATLRFALEKVLQGHEDVGRDGWMNGCGSGLLGTLKHRSKKIGFSRSWDFRILI